MSFGFCPNGVKARIFCTLPPDVPQPPTELLQKAINEAQEIISNWSKMAGGYAKAQAAGAITGQSVELIDFFSALSIFDDRACHNMWIAQNEAEKICGVRPVIWMALTSDGVANFDMAEFNKKSSYLHNEMATLSLFGDDKKSDPELG